VIPRPPAEAPPVQPPQQPPPVQETASPTEAPDSPTPTPPENVEPTEEPGHKIEPEHETKPESKTEPEPVFTFTEDEDPRAVILYANETHIANLIANAENNAVVFDFSGFDGVESAAIPAFAPGRIAYAGLYVVIRLPHGTIIFDPESARCASAQAQGGDISLALFPLSAHSNALSGAQQNALREGDALFHIALTSGEDYIRAFENGMLTVTVPFGGPFPAAVWFLDERGGLSTMLGLYCAEAGTASFVTRHLSVYIVRHFWRNPFTDVNESDPFFPAIRFVKENTLIEGTSLDTFSPDGYLSRATAVRILWHAAGKPRNDAPHIFTDVADGDEAIRWAAAKGIVVGVGDNRFAPRDYISHRHMLLLLSGYAHYFGYVMPGGLCVENAPRERVTRGEAAMLIYLLFSGD
ncbi:MAG: S-layer homology domain-containing protein, partial [Defluviitaleaceae bacterium]|nr:S-layer homology domain-containing protein [Defluviitaleaceae bacterium]